MKFEPVPANIAGFPVETTDLVVLGAGVVLVLLILAGMERGMAVLLAACCGIFAVLMS